METNNVTDQVKPWIWQTLGILLVVFLGLSVIDKGYLVSQNFKSHVPKNTLSMTGEGRVTAVPDLATVNVGVISKGTTAKEVSDDMSKKVNQITDFASLQGIDLKDITTSNFNIYQSYDYQTNKPSGYQGNESLNIKIRGLDKNSDKVGKILDGAVANGSNQIQGVSFAFDDPDNLKQQARIQAIDKAKQKAMDLAAASGLRLGKVVTISESSVTTPYPMPYALDSSKAGMGGGPVSTPDIQPGSQDITADMTVVFEIK
jgi:uncharacterized protein YggE